MEKSMSFVKKMLLFVMAALMAVCISCGIILTADTDRGNVVTAEAAGLDMDNYVLPLYIYDPMDGILQNQKCVEINASNWEPDSDGVYSKKHRIVIYSGTGRRQHVLPLVSWESGVQYSATNFINRITWQQGSGQFPSTLPARTGRFYTMAPVEPNKVFTVLYTWNSSISFILRFTYGSGSGNGLGYLCDFDLTYDQVAKLPESIFPPMNGLRAFSRRAIPLR